MHEELQRTISIENKHTLYCFKNRGLLPLSTQTFPKKCNRKSLVKRWKSKKIEETTRTKVQESVHRLQWRDWTKLVTWTVFNTAWVRCKRAVFFIFSPWCPSDRVQHRLGPDWYFLSSTFSVLQLLCIKNVIQLFPPYFPRLRLSR